MTAEHPLEVEPERRSTRQRRHGGAYLTCLDHAFDDRKLAMRRAFLHETKNNLVGYAWQLG